MAYRRVQWEESVTALSAQNMNNIEDGIEEALSKAKGNTELWHYIRNLEHPVGSLHLTTNSENPSAIYGGTWVAWGIGKVLVGVDTTDTDFNTAERTGGSKQMQSHKHKFERGIFQTEAAEVSASGVAAMMNQSDKAKLTTYFNQLTAAFNTIRTKIPFTVPTAPSLSSGTSAVIGIRNGVHTHAIRSVEDVTANAGEGGSNLQPYITCYMWKRIA